MAACHGCNGNGHVDDGTICRVCKGAGTNGVDLSVDAGREQEIRRDLLPERKLCLQRVRHGAWCQLPSAHVGECRNDTAESEYGPLEAVPSLWRSHRGQQEAKEPKVTKPTEPAAELIK